jgi:AcrR family transcriptional regulator
VLSVTEDLFGRRGYDATTIQDVATAAGIAVGTVYHHFPDKRSILLTLVDEWGDLVLAQRRSEVAFQTLFGDDPRTAIHGWLRGAYDRLRKGPSLYLVILSLAEHDDEVRQRYRRIEQVAIERLQNLIEFGQGQGLARGGIDAASAAFLIHHAIDMAATQLLVRALAGPGPELVLRELGDMICRYLLEDEM